MVSIKHFIFKVFTIIFGFVFAFALLEVAFRILPVSTPTYSNPVNSENPMANFKPNNDVVTSIGWTFEYVSHKHINNYGFFSDSDYEKKSGLPLMAVIGDSYVEAKQVDNSKTMFGLLNNEVEDFGRVYGIGVSGAPLSQYLAYANFARKEFSPDAFVFIIISNDFDESMKKYKGEPGLHYFVDHDGKLILERIDRTEHPVLIRILRESAFFMFVFVNLQLDWKKVQDNLEKLAFWRKDSNKKNSEEFFGNVPLKVSEVREKDSYRAIDAFFSMLPEKTGVSPSKILFVVDGMRQAIYSGTEQKDSYLFKMREDFMGKARKKGYGVIDMHPVFQNDYLKNGDKFEYSIDYHWNELGHFLVAREIGKSKTFERFLGRKVVLNSRPEGRRY